MLYLSPLRLTAQALAKLNQRSHLKQVAKKARLQNIREQAEQRIADQRKVQAQPSDEQVRRLRRAKLQTLAEEASVLSLRSSWARTAERFEAIQSEQASILAEQAAVGLR